MVRVGHGEGDSISPGKLAPPLLQPVQAEAIFCAAVERQSPTGDPEAAAAAQGSASPVPPPVGTDESDSWESSATSLDDDPPDSRSVLGLPLRMVLALGSIVFPLLAVSWFSGTHEWSAVPSCAFAVLGCPGATPLAVQGLDRLDFGGPILGLISAISAFGLRREPHETGILVLRFAIPVVGLFVTAGCALQLSWWLAS